MSQTTSTRENGIVAYVQDVDNDIYVVTVDARTSRIAKNNVKIGSCKKFVMEIPKLFKRDIKAVIFNVFGVESSHFSNNYAFCKAIKVKLDQMKLSYSFVDAYQHLCSYLLIDNNVAVGIGESVLIVLVNKKGIHSMDLRYTKDGYELQGSTPYFPFNPAESHETIGQKIMGTSNPKKIIVSPNAPGYPVMKYIKQILNHKDVIVAEYEVYKHDQKFVTETAKYLFDKSYTKYWIIPRLSYGYSIQLSTGNAKIIDLMFILPPVQLPVEKEIICERSLFNFSFLQINPQLITEEPLEHFLFPKNCHQVKLNISIDQNHFPSFQVSPEMIPKIEFLPEFLNRHVPSEAPVIGFFANSSVILHRKNGRYQFLDSWNGVYGRELLISFATKKPTFMEDAAEDLRTKPSYVVLDLMRITSMPINEIKHNGPWNFKFTKDVDHPLLIEFDKADGSRGAAAPAFLMAMLLKEHLKALKDETGNKPKKIVFCLLDDYKMDERQRIEEQFEEACKLLKVETSYLFYFLLTV
uniref:Uncharacterized protein n=1 Tax=Panagrolaimus sp. PS1159 TaxID=55785 RepID=A0AC35GSQ2_9BILA